MPDVIALDKIRKERLKREEDINNIRQDISKLKRLIVLGW